MDLLNSLNEKQKEAVITNDVPLRIIAGAGSGKTKVITTKIAYLISELKHKPYKILAMTFTNKAANEMKHRVKSIINSEYQPNISTFHAWCTRVLREEHSAANLKKEFLIIDQYDQKSIIKKIIKDNNFEINMHTATYEKIIMNKISEWKNNFIDWEEASREDYDNSHFSFSVIYKIYEEYLKFNNLVDFNDLQTKVYSIFNENADILEKWRERYSYILVDEFQDTNKLQFDLIKFLTRNKNSLTVVGDPDQTIYSWRGAELNIILDFPKVYKNAKTILLNENYRSTQNILDLSNNFISQNQNREKKQIFTKNQEGKKPLLKECYSLLDESKFVAREIQKLVKTENYNYKDFFVLYRNNAWSRSFENTFWEEKIPFQLLGGIKFSERAVIKKTLSFLSCIAIKDSFSTEKTLSIFKGIGAQAIEKINLEIQNSNITIFDFIVNSKVEDLQKINKNLKLVKDLFIEAEQMFVNDESIKTITEFCLVKSGMIDSFKAKNDKDSLEHIDALYDWICQFESDFKEDETGSNKLLDFLHINSLASSEDETESLNKVTLLTIHSAKGLENKVVFLVGLNKDVFPSVRSIRLIKDLEEERRALYVGMTRAKELLYISYIKGEYLHQSKCEGKASQFIHELNKDFLEFKETFWRENKDFKCKLQKEQKSLEVKLKYEIGQTVEHIIFGLGVLEKIIENKIQIKFQNSMFGTMVLDYEDIKE